MSPCAHTLRASLSSLSLSSSDARGENCGLGHDSLCLASPRSTPMPCVLLNPRLLWLCSRHQSTILKSNIAKCCRRGRSVIVMVGSTFGKEDIIWTVALGATAKDILEKSLYAGARSRSLWSRSREPSWPVMARSPLGAGCGQGRDPPALDQPQVKTLLAFVLLSLEESESWHWEGIRKSGQASHILRSAGQGQ